MTAILMPTAPRVHRMEKCENCKHHEPSADGRQIECHIRLRSDLIQGQNGQPVPVAYFPPVVRDWYCSEHRPRIEIGKPS